MKVLLQSTFWLKSSQRRLGKMKFRAQNKVASEIPVLSVRNASVKKRTPQDRALPGKRKEAFFRRGTKADYICSGTFQEAIGPVLLLAQVFSLMPVSGVTCKSAQDLKFSWKHLRTYYSLLVITSMAVCAGFNIAFAWRNSLTLDSVESIIFYVSIVLITSSFFSLARRWPNLVVQWQEVERKLPALRNEKERSQLSYRIKMIALIATLCSLMEHVLSMLSIIYYVNNCPVLPDKPIDSFLHTSFGQFFYFVEYSTLAGILGKVVNVISTFTWNFNDIFVMSVSVALSQRFRQLNEHMLRAAKRPTKPQFWVDNRVSYRSLCKLCGAVDDNISSITFVCFSNNLYFICGKILRSLQKKPSAVQTLYFWFSLFFLLGRTLALSLYAAEIHDESKRPLSIFRAISRKSWCSELKRFSEEVTTDTVALSGLKFFHLTRRLVVSVTGTIVTYELVLMQFVSQYRVNDCYEG